MKDTNLQEIRDMSVLLFNAVPIEADEVLGMFVQHPFIGSIVDYDTENQIMLDLRKEDDLQKCREIWIKRIQEGDLLRIYMFIRTPYKMTWFKYCNEFMNEEDYGKYLEDCWVSQENPNQDVNVSRKESVSLFKKANKKYLMTEEDYEYFNNLPEEIEIWRGVSPGREEYGLSWTDDYGKAVWFKERFERDSVEGYLLHAKINKRDVLAYFNSRNESELVVDVFKIKKSIERL